MSTVSKLTVEHAIEGRELPQAEPRCTDCGTRLREGHPITTAVEPTTESWTISRLWCVGCAPTRNAAVDEPLLIEGDVATVADAARQRYYPVLIEAAAVGPERVIEA